MTSLIGTIYVWKLRGTRNSLYGHFGYFSPFLKLWDVSVQKINIESSNGFLVMEDTSLAINV